jgi:hypothetical protein
MVRSLHYHQYDELHLQYLEILCDWKHGNMSNFFERVTPFGAFGDHDGYPGFVSNAQYFWLFYDTLIEKWSRELVQQIAMLLARCLGIDESFKVSWLVSAVVYLSG